MLDLLALKIEVKIPAEKPSIGKLRELGHIVKYSHSENDKLLWFSSEFSVIDLLSHSKNSLKKTKLGKLSNKN